MSQQLHRWVFSQQRHCCYCGSASLVLLILKNRCSVSSLNAEPRWIDSLSTRRINFLKALASSLHESSCWISLFSPHKLTCSVPKRAIKQGPASSCWLNMQSRGCLLHPTENRLLSADFQRERRWWLFSHGCFTITSASFPTRWTFSL